MSSAHVVKATLTAVVDVLSSTVESYRAAFEACAEVNSLCIHAEGREDPHPGIAKFQRMFFAMPPEPHETRINASLFILKSLHDDDEYGIRQWKEEIDLEIERLKTATEQMQDILEEKHVKEFLAMERKVVAIEADMEAMGRGEGSAELVDVENVKEDTKDLSVAQ